MPDSAPPGGLSALVPLATELCDLKRIRDATSPDSIATRLFRRAWGRVAAGHDVDEVALSTTADAIAAARLGGIDRKVLADCGMSGGVADAILARSFDEVAGPVSAGLRAELRAHLGSETFGGAAPDFTEALIRQPRAGATAPGKPRLVLEPTENHGDHCLVVAVLGVLLSAPFGAGPSHPFLAGLAHHLHNAVLPDSGFAGEMLLGDHLESIMHRLFERELSTLDEGVHAATGRALFTIRDAATPDGRAFHAADVIDRVLQMRHYAQVAGFTIDQALDDLSLVHEGPIQGFHQAVLHDAGLP